jgi:heme/copper-type cytochrome/quinol oxidase subunit 1
MAELSEMMSKHERLDVPKARSPPPSEPTIMIAPKTVLLLGVIFIFGGETFCVLGPLRYERVVHATCHAVLYAGIALVCLGALIHWRGKTPP